MRVLRAIVVVAAALGCGPLGVAAAAEAPVATVGARSISRAELNEHVRPKLIELENERYEALRVGLDEMVADELLKQEAKARNMTPEALEKQEIDAKVVAPTDAEIQKVYDDNKEQLKGQTLEQLKPRIIEYLKGQRAAERRAAFVSELRAKHKTTIALRPPVVQVDTAGRPERGGGVKAPITIIEFSDYECPFCGRAEKIVNQVMTTYGDRIRLVYRDFPLEMHQHSRLASEAANCANAQGKFWEYHAKLFDNQTALSEEQLKSYAGELGLDKAKFETCLKEKPFKAAIDKDMTDGSKVGVNGTPAFFINGRMLSGAQPFDKFKEVIDDELANAKKS